MAEDDGLSVLLTPTPYQFLDEPLQCAACNNLPQKAETKNLSGPDSWPDRFEINLGFITKNAGGEGAAVANQTMASVITGNGGTLERHWNVGGTALWRFSSGSPAFIGFTARYHQSRFKIHETTLDGLSKYFPGLEKTLNDLLDIARDAQPVLEGLSEDEKKEPLDIPKNARDLLKQTIQKGMTLTTNDLLLGTVFFIQGPIISHTTPDWFIDWPIFNMRLGISYMHLWGNVESPVITQKGSFEGNGGRLDFGVGSELGFGTNDIRMSVGVNFMLFLEYYSGRIKETDASLYGVNAGYMPEIILSVELPH